MRWKSAKSQPEGVFKDRVVMNIDIWTFSWKWSKSIKACPRSFERISEVSVAKRSFTGSFLSQMLKSQKHTWIFLCEAALGNPGCIKGNIRPKSHKRSLHRTESFCRSIEHCYSNTDIPHTHVQSSLLWAWLRATCHSGWRTRHGWYSPTPQGTNIKFIQSINISPRLLSCVSCPFSVNSPLFN